MGKLKNRLVLIEWEDSAVTRGGWQTVNDAKRQLGGPVLIASVGWLLKDGRRSKSLVANVGGLDGRASAQCCGIITIPTSCILSIKELSDAA